MQRFSTRVGVPLNKSPTCLLIAVPADIARQPLAGTASCALAVAAAHWMKAQSRTWRLSPVRTTAPALQLQCRQGGGAGGRGCPLRAA